MLEITIGIALITVLLFDIFQAVLVPRFTPASLRIAPLLVGSVAWPQFRRIAGFIDNEELLDFFLGSFAPLAFVMIFVLWVLSLIFGFALIIHGMANQFHPIVTDFTSAMYLAGTSLLTLGFGDIVAITPIGRAILLMAATTGITIVAIGVSFLFSMQQSVHARESVVHTMQTRIAPHSSALSLLLNYADLNAKDVLASQFHDWENWYSELLTSHRSFPLLFYFRSGHMCVPWITVIGVMLDTANLLTTTIDEEKFGHAHFFLQMGSKMTNFFRCYFNLDPAHSSISREEFSAAYLLLQERGYCLQDEEIAWEKFHLTRSEYAPSLTALAFNFICPTPGWLPPDHLLQKQSYKTAVEYEATVVS